MRLVSVSYRSYILSYEMRIPENIKLIIAQFVSVSYWSYILSYLMEDLYFKSEEAKMFPSPIGVIFSLIFWLNICRYLSICYHFRLLSELYSHLFCTLIEPIIEIARFPSPIGVIFSLIKRK